MDIEKENKKIKLVAELRSKFNKNDIKKILKENLEFFMYYNKQSLYEFSHFIKELFLEEDLGFKNINDVPLFEDKHLEKITNKETELMMKVGNSIMMISMLFKVEDISCFFSEKDIKNLEFILNDLNEDSVYEDIDKFNSEANEILNNIKKCK